MLTTLRADSPTRRSEPPPAARELRSMNCLSIDVEEYFHAEAFAQALPRSRWPQMESRAGRGLEQILTMLERHDQRATFFVLGQCVRPLGSLLRAARDAGSEIACHGFGHQHLSRMTPQQLRDDVSRAIDEISDVLGVTPLGYRAPTFSVTRATGWALDVLLEAGFEYDASVFPIHHDRYGVPDAPGVVFRALTPNGNEILEFPPLTMRCGPLRFPVGGGGYLRLLPGAVPRRALAQRQRRGQAAMLYVHPWELDPEQPRIPIGPLAQWRHRVNLHTTARKLERLLCGFRFETALDIVRHLRTRRNPPPYSFRADLRGTD